MFDIDKWTEIYHVLSKNRLRTFLTGFGVFSGVFTLIILLGTGDGFEKGVKQGFSRVASNSFFIWRGKTTMAYKGYAPGRSITPKISDPDVLKQKIPEIKTVYPRVSLGGFGGASRVVRGTMSEAFPVSGDMPGIYDVYSIFMKEGRFLNQGDMNEYRKVAVIGERVKEVLFQKDEDPIGQLISIKGIYFKIIGVSSTNSTGSRSERDLETIYVPISTFQKVFNTGQNISYIVVTGYDDANPEKLLDDCLTTMRYKNKIHPKDAFAYGYFNMAKTFSNINFIFVGIRILIWVVGIGTLIAGAVGVSNIMLIVVSERTQEFGVRRAIGAKPWSIISQVILESVFLTTIAGILGFIIGALFIESGIMEQLIHYFSDGKSKIFLNPSVNFKAAFSAIWMIVFFGALSGLLPARRAIKIRPVDALRSE